jgi:hypothetical protein
MEKSKIIEALLVHKGANLQLSKNFNSREFECSCMWEDCRVVTVTKDCLYALQYTRDDFGDSIYVNSANRCPRRNEMIGGVEDSSHVWGDGVDIRTVRREDLDALEAIARKHFKYVKRYSTYLHCDQRFHRLKP